MALKTKSGSRSNKKSNGRTQLSTKTPTKASSSQKEVRTKVKKVLKLPSKTFETSICVPTSAISSCVNIEQITYTVYQIAQAAVLFAVGEVVVLETNDEPAKSHKEDELSDSMLIATLLQYFVTPPYLLRTVFKQKYFHYFKYAAKLPRLSALPFMRYYLSNKNRYREGLAIPMSKERISQVNNSSGSSKKTFKQTKHINIGKSEPLVLKSQLVPTNVRVTVDLLEKRIVSPSEAYGDFVGAKASFGYQVRVANTFAELFTDSSWPQGYSQAIWVNSGDYYFDESLTKYKRISNIIPHIERIVTRPRSNGQDIHDEKSSTEQEIPAILLVFGKWDHIKNSFNSSREQFEGCDGAHQFFDGQLDLPGAVPQGNVTIHDSCLISLTLLGSMSANIQ